MISLNESYKYDRNVLVVSENVSTKDFLHREQPPDKQLALAKIRKSLVTICNYLFSISLNLINFPLFRVLKGMTDKLMYIPNDDT